MALLQVNHNPYFKGGKLMKKAIVFTTLMLILSTTLLYPIATHAQMTEVQQAEADALRDVEQDVSTISWGIGGFFCSVCAVAYVYIDKPQVPAARLVGKSAEYVSFYTDTYNREVRKKRGQAALIGCLASSLLNTLTFYLTSQSQE